MNTLFLGVAGMGNSTIRGIITEIRGDWKFQAESCLVCGSRFLCVLFLKSPGSKKLGIFWGQPNSNIP